GLPQDASRLGTAALTPKIAEQAAAQAFRLADINQFTLPIEHAVDARLARAEAPHFTAELRRALAMDESEFRRLRAGLKRARSESQASLREQAIHDGSFRPACHRLRSMMT